MWWLTNTELNIRTTSNNNNNLFIGKQTDWWSFEFQEIFVGWRQGEGINLNKGMHHPDKTLLSRQMSVWCLWSFCFNRKKCQNQHKSVSRSIVQSASFFLITPVQGNKQEQNDDVGLLCKIDYGVVLFFFYFAFSV